MAERSLRERIGGRWAVSVPAFIVIAVLACLSTATVDNLTGAYDLNRGAVMAANLASAGVIAAVLWFAHLTVFRHRAVRPVPVWAVAAVGGIASAARLAVVIPVHVAVGVPVDRVMVRVGVALLMGALLLPAVAAIIDSIETEAARRRVLVRRAAELRRGEAGGTALAEAITDAVFREVAQAATAAREELDASSAGGTPEQRAAAAVRLRRVVETSLRPLSHRLYAIQSQPLPRPSAWPSVRAAFRDSALQPVAAGVVVMVVALPVAVTYSWPWAILRPLLSGLQLALVLALVMWIARRVPVVHRHLALIGVVAGVVGSTTRLAVLASLGVDVGGPVVFVVNALLTAVAILATGAVAAAVRGNRAAGARLEDVVSAREVEAYVAALELARVSRDLAQHLHGTVQAHLLTAAFAMEQAASDGDAEAFSRVVAEARGALDADALEAGPRGDIRDELDHRVALWQGFLDLSVEVDPALRGLPPDACADIGRIVEGAVGNAHKHGDATSARVVVGMGPPGFVDVMVRDDGTGPRPGEPGLGSAFLDFVAPGAWALEPNEGDHGATLRVRLPLRTAPGAPTGSPAAPGHPTVR